MRLNAFLARAGVASRRRADELIRGGRVRVNGHVGELNTVVGRHDVVEVDGDSRGTPAARVRAPAQAARSGHDGARSAGPGDRRRSRPIGSSHRARRPPRRGHDGRPPAHERRRARAPARAPALWRRRRSTRRTSRERRREPRSSPRQRGRARRRHDRARRRSCRLDEPSPQLHRADAPRGPQASGEADAARPSATPCGACIARAMRASTSTASKQGEWRVLTTERDRQCSAARSGSSRGARTPSARTSPRASAARRLAAFSAPSARRRRSSLGPRGAREALSGTARAARRRLRRRRS